MCVHVYVFVCIRTCMCVYVCCVFVCNVRIHTSSSHSTQQLCTTIHHTITCVCVCACVCVHVCVRMCVCLCVMCACTCACTCTCMCVCTCVCMCGYVHVWGRCVCVMCMYIRHSPTQHNMHNNTSHHQLPIKFTFRYFQHTQTVTMATYQLG